MSAASAGAVPSHIVAQSASKNAVVARQTELFSSRKLIVVPNMVLILSWSWVMGSWAWGGMELSLRLGLGVEGFDGGCFGVHAFSADRDVSDKPFFSAKPAFTAAR